ncbi:MAG: methyl-accepting chemotaxis protein [Candidatus Pristimantibacillus sp.]
MSTNKNRLNRINPRNIKLTLFGKNLLLSSLNIVMIALILLLSSYFIQERLLIRTLNEQAVGFTKLASSEFELEDVRQAFTTHDINSPLQKKLIQKIAHFQEMNNSVSHSYLIGSDLQAGNTSTLLAVPQDYIEGGYMPGDTYEQSPVMLKALNMMTETKSSAITGIYKNDYGQWLTVVHPIMADSGEIIAAFAVDLNANVISDGKRELLLWTFSILMAALIVVLSIQFVVLRRVLAPIKDLYHAFSEVSGGQLNVQLPTIRRDELGLLNVRFNEMAAGLREMIRGVQDNANLATVQANDLATSVDQSMKSLSEISYNIGQVAAGATTQEQVALESSRAMEEMAVGIQRIAESSNTMGQASEHMSSEASQGNHYIQKVIHQMDCINQSVHASSQSVISLSERSNEITHIVDAISGIAAQTNLLALNAAIEAARAGEQGKGFAVVASEVRKLAEQSHKAAAQIGTVIDEIQQEIRNAVHVMNNGKNDTLQGIQFAAETGEKFQVLYAATQNVTSMVQEVSAVAEQMSAGSEEVASSVQELSTIAEKSSKVAIDVAHESEEQLKAAKEIGASAIALNEMAQRLQTLISKFKL